MRSSGTSFQNRKIDVVVANEPIPRVSKKFVTNPVAILAPLTLPSAGARRKPAVNTTR